MTAASFWYYRHWTDEHGRTWAEPHYYLIPSDARASHTAASRFLWVTAGMHNPKVSALLARDRHGVVELQPATEPADTQVRSTDGPVQVSSVAKAEVQRRDPGSIPGGSTGLPF